MNGKKSYYNLINIKNKEATSLRDNFFIFLSQAIWRNSILLKKVKLKQ